MRYDHNNIFAKIIKKELPCDLINENKNALAFKDISPRAPVHILIVPKKGYMNYHDFISNGSKEEIIDLNELIKAIITEMKLDHSGYRIITNTGDDGNQDVKHLHFHLLGGKNLGLMVK